MCHRLCRGVACTKSEFVLSKGVLFHLGQLSLHVGGEVFGIVAYEYHGLSIEDIGVVASLTHVVDGGVDFGVDGLEFLLLCLLDVALSELCGFLDFLLHLAEFLLYLIFLGLVHGALRLLVFFYLALELGLHGLQGVFFFLAESLQLTVHLCDVGKGLKDGL